MAPAAPIRSSVRCRPIGGACPATSALRRRFLSACKVLGLARLRTLTIHHGRHTFISHALAGKRSLAAVAGAAGPPNIAVTSIYLHVTVDDDDVVGDLFQFGR